MAALAGPPKDRTKTEHVAEVRRIVFENPDGPFVILELLDGSTAMGAATADQFDNKTQYRFLGRWENDPKRGYRFRFGSFIVHAIGSRTGVVKYITAICPGIGSKTAAKLWDAYRERAIDTLRDDPARCATECGINAETVYEASEILIADKRYQHTKIDLNGLFAGRGFQGKLIDDCVTRWGVKAAAFIRQNPFRLLGMTSAGFKRCDKLYMDLGLNPKALKRQVICTLHAITTDRTGHTWFDAYTLEAMLKDAIPQADAHRAFRCGVRARVLSVREDERGRVWLTSRNRARAEEMIAQHVTRLNRVSLWPINLVPVSQAEGDRLPSAHQVGELRKATAWSVGLFCGGPGTGKSHTLAYLLREVIAEFGRDAVAAVAPTGKAAVRMSQALKAAGVDLPTSTIHSLLIKCGAISVGGKGDGFEGNGDRPGRVEAQFVIVDEASMIDANLMAVLLSAMSSGTHVLFIGDPYQLPPVGHGSPLRDLIAFGGVPYGELVQVRRTAGQIVHACLRVKNGESYETTEAIDLDAVPPLNLKHLETRNEAGSVEVLEHVLRNMTGFHPVWQTQVIVARNKGGAITRTELNGRLQTLLNQDGHTSPPNPFRVADKVICLKNCWQTAVRLYCDADFASDSMRWDAKNYETVYATTEGFHGAEVSSNTPREVYTANGEIGRVIAVGPKLTIAIFSEGEFAVRIPMGAGKDETDGDDAEDTGRGCNFDLAYAVTCHKLQGSEAPCVVVMVDPQGGGVAGREWWYTAISRAAKACLTVGQQAAIDKQRARVSTAVRKTFLVESLRALALPTNNDGWLHDAEFI